MKLKVSLIALALLFSAPMVLARIGDLGVSFSMLIYVGLNAALVVGLILAASVRWAPVRWLYALMFAGGLAFSSSFENAMGQELTYDAFNNMWSSRGFIGDAIDQFGSSIAWGGVQAALLLFGLGLAPRTSNASVGSKRALIPAVLCLVLSMLVYVRGGDGTRGLPGAFVTPAFATVQAIDYAINTPGPREKVKIARQGPRVDQDIVLIVDESVAANYLDINRTGGVYSGLGVKRPGVGIHNFGVAASITHCSVGSNLTLRFGGTRENYREINATGPSIWSYAKAAGLGTAYIDAQRTGESYQNGMDAVERAAIDHWVQFENVAVVDRDQAVADELARLLNDGKPQFIYVNKMGGHFPVNAKYPENRKLYVPAAPRNAFDGAAEKSARDVFKGGAEEWRLYRNAYRNTIAWNVGAFFDRLFAKAKVGGALVIYTSDHGQNLHERGGLGKATHCTPEPIAEEGAVPLVVLDGKAPGQSVWEAAAKRARNTSSHYRIFPTLLNQMGYDRKAVKNAYGPSLDDDSTDPMTFNPYFNARLGRAPVWMKIDPEKIAKPSVLDFEMRR
jgi:Sulfatase